MRQRKNTARHRPAAQIRDRREARAAMVARRVELIDNAIDMCDALDKAFDQLNVPEADRDVIADGRATLRKVYGALERVRGLDDL